VSTYYDWTVQQGADKDWKFSLVDGAGNPLPTGTGTWSARVQVREAAEAPAVLVEWSTADASITIDATGGVFVHQRRAQLTGVSWRAGVYQLHVINPDGLAGIPIYGRFTLIPAVVR
jgi:hypothetical protein